MKVQRAQAAGATAVVIVDNGGCNEQYECGVLGDRSNGRFSAQDHAELWRDITIPTVLSLNEPGGRLKKVMDLEEMDLPELGRQYMEQED